MIHGLGLGSCQIYLQTTVMWAFMKKNVGVNFLNTIKVK